MKQTLFIMTHLGSGWEKLAEALERDKRFHVFNTGGSYHHPDDVLKLTNQIHRKDNSAAVYADVIFHNKDFTMKRLMDHYKMIFWSNDFNDCRDELTLKHGYGSDQAELYHAHRLEGMRQYWRRCQSVWNPELQGDPLFSAIL